MSAEMLSRGTSPTVLVDQLLLGAGVQVRALRSVATEALVVLAGAALVGLLAQVNVPMWPVPITGQTLGVMLVGAALGARRAALSMLSYLLLGVLGVPWFANFTGGVAAVAKPSFGFIIGFIPAAMLVGYLAECRWDRHRLLSLAAFGMASVVPFLVGIPYMWMVLGSLGKSLTFAQVLQLGFIPFIVGGVAKWLLGSVIISASWWALGHGARDL